MKKIIVFIISFMLIINLTACGTIDEEVETSFEICKPSFEILNQFFKDYYSSVKLKGEELNFAFSFEENKEYVDKIYAGHLCEYIYVEDDIATALYDIKKAFKYDLSLISVTDTRISYGGQGNEMFVYSLNGKKPKYFLDEEYDISFSTYSLGDDWYYLFLRVR